MVTWVDINISGSAVRHAGANVNTAIIVSGGALDMYYTEETGYITAATRRDWETNYTGLPTGIKREYGRIIAAHIGKNLVKYDQAGYLSGENIFIINVLTDDIAEGIRVLKDFNSNEIKTP